MTGIYAVNIVSALSTSADNGKVEVVGENALVQWVLDGFKVKMTRQTEFLVDCSCAYTLANLKINNPKVQAIIDQCS